MRPEHDESVGAALLATVCFVVTVALVYLCALLLAR